MDFLVSNYIKYFKEGLTFSGKSTRKEYFSVMLVGFVINIMVLLTVPALLGVLTLINILPSIAILIRRFRDADVTPYAILAVLPVYVVIFMKSK